MFYNTWKVAGEAKHLMQNLNKLFSNMWKNPAHTNTSAQATDSVLPAGAVGASVGSQDAGSLTSAAYQSTGDNPAIISSDTHLMDHVSAGYSSEPWNTSYTCSGSVSRQNDTNTTSFYNRYSALTPSPRSGHDSNSPSPLPSQDVHEQCQIPRFQSSMTYTSNTVSVATTSRQPSTLHQRVSDTKQCFTPGNSADMSKASKRNRQTSMSDADKDAKKKVSTSDQPSNTSVPTLQHGYRNPQLHNQWLGNQGQPYSGMPTLQQAYGNPQLHNQWLLVGNQGQRNFGLQQMQSFNTSSHFQFQSSDCEHGRFRHGGSKGPSERGIAKSSGCGTQSSPAEMSGQPSQHRSIWINQRQAGSKPSVREAKLRDRHWTYAPISRQLQGKMAPRSQDIFQFTVASYNLLSQDLLETNSYLYEHCNAEHLTWEYRRQNLLAEISFRSPDILCLQEMNCWHYEEFFIHLKKKGYDGLYQKRSGNKLDGCAIFYKTARFQLVDCVPLEYMVPGVPVLDRDNVAVLVLLKVRSRSAKKANLICVATTHLLFNPRRGDVKLAQLWMLLAEIDKLAHIPTSEGPLSAKYHPVILCGDFNLEPHCDLYRLLVQGRLRYEGLLQRSMSGQEEGRYGNNRYLPRKFFPSKVAITDWCQFVPLFQSRMQACIAERCVASAVARSKCQTVESARTADSTAEEGKLSVSSSSSPQDGNEKEGKTNEPTQKTDKKEFSTENTSSETPVQSESGQRSSGAVEGSSQAGTAHQGQGSGQVSHQLPLVSAYQHFSCRRRRDGEQREVTTHHSRASCTVDYVLYTVASRQTHLKKGRVITRNVAEGPLSLIATLDLLTDREMADVGTLPNDVVSSDHTMLMAKFMLKLKK